MARRSTWLAAAVLGIVGLAWGRLGPAEEAKEPPPDAQMLLDLDFLKDADLGKDRDFLRRMAIVEQLRVLESLRLLESPTEIAPAQREVK